MNIMSYYRLYLLYIRTTLWIIQIAPHMILYRIVSYIAYTHPSLSSIVHTLPYLAYIPNTFTAHHFLHTL